MKLIYKLSFLLLIFLLGELSPVKVLAQQGNEKQLITNLDRTLTVYPIPANDRVTIRISSGLINNVDKIEIVSLIGRKIAEQTIIDNNATEITFNGLDDFPPGVYMVLARDKSGRIVQSSKMVINR